jgi:hypothetical protein
MTFAVYLLLATVSALVVVAFFGFLGCDAPDADGGIPIQSRWAHVLIRLKHDPNLVVNNMKVAVGRVDFAVHRQDGPGTGYDLTMTLDASGAAVYEYNGTPSDPNLAYAADPQWGDFFFVWYHHESRLPPTHWKVSCNAYRQASDTTPAYASLGVIEKTVDQAAFPPLSYPFVFTINAQGKTVPAPIPGQTPNVVLSFKYNAANIAKVVFTITRAAGSTREELKDPEGRTPNATWDPLGAVISKVVASDKNGEFALTIGNAPPGRWGVTCNAFDSKQPNAAPKFEYQGPANEVDVQPIDQTYRLEFKLSGQGTGRFVERDV